MEQERNKNEKKLDEINKTLTEILVSQGKANVSLEALIKDSDSTSILLRSHEKKIDKIEITLKSLKWGGSLIATVLVGVIIKIITASLGV